MSDAEEGIAGLEAALGHRFRDASLGELALAHPSYTYEIDGSRGNERLEFLGDAVLGLLVARLLYEARPEWHEGQLTRSRAALVNQQSLAERARALGLPDLVRLGRTERRTAGNEKPSILANCFEAVIGALYLDGGLDAVEPVVARCFRDAISGSVAPRDAKTAFQEWTHANLQCTPTYGTVHDSGVENDEARFTVEVYVGDEAWGRGVGRTKRAAEAAAAESALARAVARP